MDFLQVGKLGFVGQGGRVRIKILELTSTSKQLCDMIITSDFNMSVLHYLLGKLLVKLFYS